MDKRKLALCVAAALAFAVRTGIAQVAGGLPAEISARETADAQLQGQIDQLRSIVGGSAGTVNVDCTAGGSVSAALAGGAQQIIVRGTCVESLSVGRDGVTLRGEAGGTIRGPDADTDTVIVTGQRVTVDGLTVTGGRNGISAFGAANLIVRNATVQSTGRTGIVYANGSSGQIDNCVVQSNARDGVAVDAAQATIINSTMTNNARGGVSVFNGGRARIGITDRAIGAGNTISQNGATGVSVTLGGTATITMNAITDNGTNASSPGRGGVGVVQATASITGGNTISGNAGAGVSVAFGSSVLVGDPAPGLTTINTISANGNANSPGGVGAFLGATVIVRDALIEGNFGGGLVLSTRSQGQVINSTIQNNRDVRNAAGALIGGDGIRLILGSALLPATPMSTISSNDGFGLLCTDAESSAINTSLPFIQYFGNMRGDNLPNCTGFF